MDSKITEFLELLRDGEWHKQDEIQKRMNLEKQEFQKIVAFLREYNFVLVEEVRKTIRIEENARKFLVQSPNS